MRLFVAVCLSALAVVFGCDQPRQPTAPAKVASVPVVAAESPKQELPRATAGKELAKLGPASISITEAEVGRFNLVSVLGERFVTKGDVLRLSLRISTKDKNKKINYVSWSKNPDAVVLSDNFGNRYKMMTDGFAYRPEDGNSEGSVTADKSVDDALLFEPPIPTATHLTIDLSAEHVGLKSSDMFRFRIPKAMWEKK